MMATRLKIAFFPDEGFGPTASNESRRGTWPSLRFRPSYHRSGLRPAGDGNEEGYLVYASTIPSLVMVKVLPWTLPRVVPAPSHFMVSIEPCRV